MFEQDYILTPYIAEVINTLTNVTYCTLFYSELSLLKKPSASQIPRDWSRHVGLSQYRERNDAMRGPDLDKLITNFDFGSNH